MAKNSVKSSREIKISMLFRRIILKVFLVIHQKKKKKTHFLLTKCDIFVQQKKKHGTVSFINYKPDIVLYKSGCMAK